MIHLLHHLRDPRFGDVDIILDARLTGLNVAAASSSIFAAAKKAKRRIAAIQRQCGGTTFFTYAPADEEKVAMALIAAMTACLGQPLLVPETRSNDGDY